MNAGKGLVLGWKEWVSLPQLGITAIKAKIDTGARTSALHTYDLEKVIKNGKDLVKFSIHPLQRRTDISLNCEAEIIDTRIVKDSGGHSEERYIIMTPILMNGVEWDIEVSLTNREDMLFNMLLGRTAMVKNNISVDPSRSYVTGKNISNSYD